MKTHQLKWVSQVLPKRNNKWFAAIEQSGLSANNFFYSLVIITFAGVGELGVYAFWFVVCQFMGMLTMGLATRQMVLEYADKSWVERLNGFWATCAIVLVLQVVQVLMLGALVHFFPPENGALVFWSALAVYSVSFNLAELYRQFYYMGSRQRLSLCYSTISVASGALGFLVFSISRVFDAPELSAFWFLACGNLIYIAFTYCSMKQRIQVSGPSSATARQLFQQYRKHGVPATGGMLVTWMQNQSVTPLLMFMLGPLVVGYYSVARMIITPLNMVTTGLSKSALPQIRKAYGDGNQPALDLAIRAHRQTNMRIVYYYVTLVVIGGLLTQLFGMLDASDTQIAMFVATLLVASLSNYRFWISQYFVVRMQFGIILRLGIVASCATVIMMLIGGLVAKSALWVVFGPALGEIILIFTTKHKLGRPFESKSTDA